MADFSTSTAGQGLPHSGGTGGGSSQGDSGGGASGMAGEAMRRVSEGARSLAGSATETISDFAEGQKDTVSQYIEDFADAIRAASDELRDRDQTMASSLVRQAASGLEDVARAVSGATMGDLLSTVRSFGRSNPAAFIGGAVLVGLALGRFARSSAPQMSYEDDEDNAPSSSGSSMGRGGYSGRPRVGPTSGYPGGGSSAGRSGGSGSSGGGTGRAGMAGSGGFGSGASGGATSGGGASYGSGSSGQTSYGTGSSGGGSSGSGTRSPTGGASGAAGATAGTGVGGISGSTGGSNESDR